MGSWGTALYSNDTSSDVRDMCNEVYPLLSIEEGTKIIFEAYADIINSSIIDNDYADFWFALADWQWKHGILTDEIKNKTISLLEDHAGIEEWQESGTAADIKKRLSVLDKLLDQLKKPQPEMNIPKAKLVKPKHKPGDIIIIHTCSEDYEYAYSTYNLETCAAPYLYVPEISDKLKKNIYPPYKACNKYIAILCVGTEKILHSQYVKDIFDEYSVYAFYDYIDDKEPSLDQLKQCGFLPSLVMYSYNQGIDTLEWRYKFMLYAYSFKLSKYTCEQSLEKLYCPSENERFHSLFSQKNYSGEVTDEFELPNAFASFFVEKVRLSLAGIAYDNLLDSNISNPSLRSKKEVDEIISMGFEEK